MLDTKLTKTRIDIIGKEYSRVIDLLEDIAVNIMKNKTGSAEHVMAIGFAIGQMNSKILDDRLELLKENLNKEVKNSL